MGQFIILYGTRDGSKLYYGKGWRPYASKRSAVRFPTRTAAEKRLEGVRKVFAHNPDWDQTLISAATIVEA